MYPKFEVGLFGCDFYRKVKNKLFMLLSGVASVIFEAMLKIIKMLRKCIIGIRSSQAFILKTISAIHVIKVPLF